MGRSGFEGEEVAKAMLNSSVGWVPKGRTGSHLILEWVPPETHSTDRRTVSIPMDDLPEGTFRSIAEDAGAKDISAFKDWIEDNM